MKDVDEIVRSLRGGKLAVLPTDTVYGLVCVASAMEPATDLYRLKGRSSIQPTAVIFASVDALSRHLPELDTRSLAILSALLPGQYTFVVPNPAHRFAWLTEGRPGSIGVRVPTLAGDTALIVAELEAVVATSANLPGEHDPRTLADVPAEILAGVVAAIDGGELPGTPSTVIDITGSEALVIRAGAGDPAAALDRIASLDTHG